MAESDTSLQDFLGRNLTDDIRPEIAIKVDKVSTQISRDYSIVKSISLASVEEDPSSADGFIITLLFVTTDGKTYLVDLGV
jgi:hypothetical protein